MLSILAAYAIELAVTGIIWKVLKWLFETPVKKEFRDIPQHKSKHYPPGISKIL